MLECSDNNIRVLENIPLCLKWLYCNNNQLSRLPDNLPYTLVELLCNNNKLTSLPTLPPNLLRLWCANNLSSTLNPPTRILEIIS